MVSESCALSLLKSGAVSLVQNERDRGPNSTASHIPYKTTPETARTDADSPNHPLHWGASMGLPYPKALMGSIADAFNFKRRHSGVNDPATHAAAAGLSPTAQGARAGALALGGSGLAAGRYVLEIDAAGGIKSINPLTSDGPDSGAAAAATATGAAAAARESVSGSGGSSFRRQSAPNMGVDAAGAGELQLQLLRQQNEIAALKSQLSALAVEDVAAAVASATASASGAAAAAQGEGESGDGAKAAAEAI